MKNNDELLDKIIGHLKSEPVSETPMVLTATRAAKPRGWLWYAVGASALAASLVGFLLWHSHALQPHDPRLPDVVEQRRTYSHESLDVVVRDVDLTEPLAQLEVKLDLLDAEIAELRSKADLLDAQRMADELLVWY